jgi:hypothetical protein
MDTHHPKAREVRRRLRTYAQQDHYEQLQQICLKARVRPLVIAVGLAMLALLVLAWFTQPNLTLVGTLLGGLLIWLFALSIFLVMSTLDLTQTDPKLMQVMLRYVRRRQLQLSDLGLITKHATIAGGAGGIRTASHGVMVGVIIAVAVGSRVLSTGYFLASLYFLAATALLYAFQLLRSHNDAVMQSAIAAYEQQQVDLQRMLQG